MMSTLLIFTLGLVVGWNFPQPKWAADLQRRIEFRLSSILRGRG